MQESCHFGLEIIQKRLRNKYMWDKMQQIHDCFLTFFLFFSATSWVYLIFENSRFHNGTCDREFKSWGWTGCGSVVPWNPIRRREVLHEWAKCTVHAHARVSQDTPRKGKREPLKLEEKKEKKKKTQKRNDNEI